MKELVLFSLKRRFLNKTMIIFNVIAMFFIVGLLFVDEIVKWIEPDFTKQFTVYVDKNLEDTIDMFNYYGEDKYIFQPYPKEQLENKELNLYYDQNTWIIESNYEISEIEQSAMTTIIQATQKNKFEAYENTQLLEEIQLIYEPLVINTILDQQLNYDTKQQNTIFMVITGIYFIVLSFSSTAANEVVYEKTSKILELVLTSVSSRVHFLSKIIVGWLSMIIQAIVVLMLCMGAVVFRIQYDGGLGLVHFLQSIDIIQNELHTISEVVEASNFTTIDFLNGVYCVLFVLLGVLLVQMVLVIASSYITSIEESASIQGPFYFILLIFYYFALSINTPYQMAQGMGYYLSFLPFFSMLFMPCRIMMESATQWEIALALILSVSILFLMIEFGQKYYHRGILDEKIKK